MSPVPLFCHSPPPGATLESRKNELIIYCLVYPPPGGGTFGLLGGVGQKRANFGLLGGVGKKGLILAILGFPPWPGGIPRNGTFSPLGPPPRPGPQGSPTVPPPQAAPRYPPPG